MYVALERERFPFERIGVCMIKPVVACEDDSLTRPRQPYQAAGKIPGDDRALPGNQCELVRPILRFDFNILFNVLRLRDVAGFRVPDALGRRKQVADLFVGEIVWIHCSDSWRSTLQPDHWLGV